MFYFICSIILYVENCFTPKFQEKEKKQSHCCEKKLRTKTETIFWQLRPLFAKIIFQGGFHLQIV